MKKIMMIILLAIILVGCEKEKKEDINVTDNTVEEVIAELEFYRSEYIRTMMYKSEDIDLGDTFTKEDIISAYEGVDQTYFELNRFSAYNLNFDQIINALNEQDEFFEYSLLDDVDNYHLIVQLEGKELRVESFSISDEFYGKRVQHEILMFDMYEDVFIVTAYSGVIVNGEYESELYKSFIEGQYDEYIRYNAKKDTMMYFAFEKDKDSIYFDNESDTGLKALVYFDQSNQIEFSYFGNGDVRLEYYENNIPFLLLQSDGDTYMIHYALTEVAGWTSVGEAEMTHEVMINNVPIDTMEYFIHYGRNNSPRLQTYQIPELSDAVVSLDGTGLSFDTITGTKILQDIDYVLDNSMVLYQQAFEGTQYDDVDDIVDMISEYRNNELTDKYFE